MFVNSVAGQSHFMIAVIRRNVGRTGAGLALLSMFGVDKAAGERAADASIEVSSLHVRIALCSTCCARYQLSDAMAPTDVTWHVIKCASPA